MHTISKTKPAKMSLKKGLEIFQRKHEFKIGDLVEWKPGMAFKSTTGPFIVVEVLPEPVYGGGYSAGSPYFREPLDVILGTWAVGEHGNDDFICFHMDSRRFQPVGFKEDACNCADGCNECNTPTSLQ